MARSVTLGTMRTRVRQRADIENATARFTDAEITDNLNESIAELYDLIRAAWGQDYYRSQTTFFTSGNVDTYSLPADFLSLISIDVPLGGNIVLTARPFMENERNRYKYFPFGVWTLHQPLFYRLRGQNVTFIPMPTGTYQVNVNYIPTPPILVNAGDTFDGIAGWEEYAILDAAVKCALKDENFDLINVLEGRKGAIKARIEAIGTERDAGQPERVHDVVGDDIGNDW